MNYNVRHLGLVTGLGGDGVLFQDELADYMSEWVRRAPFIEQYLRSLGATEVAEAVVAAKVAAAAVVEAVAAPASGLPWSSSFL